jgi:hypothetical protein
MKRQLFIGTALFAATSIFAQVPAKKYLGLDEISRNKYGNKGMVAHEPVQQAPANAPSAVSGPKSAAAKSKAAAFSWVRLTSSMNVFGVLLSDSKQLTYNEDLNAICLIARRGPGYTAVPNYSNIVGAYSGGILAFVSKDDGVTWDSTIVWNNDTYWARYPQGGFWNPITPSVNTTVDNAYVVVTGPITPAAGGWTGNYFASKSLSVFTNVADAQPGAQIYNDNSNPNPMFDNVNMARLDFQYTDDGRVHALGHIYNDFNSTSPATQVYRGIRYLTGNFNSGVFTWSHDSIMLHQSTVNASVTTAQITNFPMVYGGVGNMAWSENGQIGYAWFVGQRKNSTDNSMGLQPLVWRTTDAGQNWSEIPGINFNDTVKFAPVLKTVERSWDTSGTFQTALRIPHFGPGLAEDMGSIVDKNGNLHLTSMIGSTQWGMYPYVATAQEFTNVVGDGQIYSWSHLGDNIPVMFDFVYNGTANDWNFTVVDTLRTEAPATSPAAANGYGYNYNPWPVYDGGKQSCNARIQLTRSADGAYVFYTWVDTDPNFTQDAVRWNVAPDLYVRMKHADSTKMHPMKFDLTGSPLSPDVFSNARMHSTSTKVKMVGVTTPYNVSIKLPVKVMNSTPLRADLPNTTHFLNASLSFTASAPQPTTDTRLSENAVSATSSVLFPNPTSHDAFLVIDLPHANDVNVTITNIVGQRVMVQSLKGNEGFNQFSVKTEGLSAGVYMVNVRVADGVATKKLVIE